MTNIYQGNFTDGKDGDTYWRYSGSADYEMNLDFGKLGLWQGGFLKVRGMTGFRKSINSKAGSILPVNSDALFPTPDGKDYCADGFSVHAVSIPELWPSRGQDEHPWR